ncbi:mCG144572, partial [Mus musculus]
EGLLGEGGICLGHRREGAGLCRVSTMQSGRLKLRSWVRTWPQPVSKEEQQERLCGSGKGEQSQAVTNSRLRLAFGDLVFFLEEVGWSRFVAFWTAHIS